MYVYMYDMYENSKTYVLIYTYKKCIKAPMHQCSDPDKFQTEMHVIFAFFINVMHM
jgi:hypothetical protein